MRNARLLQVLISLTVIVSVTADAWAVYHAGTGRFMQRDPIGYTAGWNLYEYLRGSPAGATDPAGLWGADVHRDLTLKMAEFAGIACANDVAEGANRPDTDDRAAVKLGTSGVVSLMANDPVNALDSFNKAADWHFPGAQGGGVVDPYTKAASAKVDAGIAACDFTLFSEGLHPFQDSWSHQGTPYFAGRIVGHYRGVKIVDGKAERIDGTLEAALSESADWAWAWPEDARATGLWTYVEILKFKTECPCSCPDHKSTWGGGFTSVIQVMGYLMGKYPGDNVKTGDNVKQ